MAAQLMMKTAASQRLAVRSRRALRVNAAADTSALVTKEYLKSLPGVCDPFPDVFDPLNLSATASVKDLRRWRESEIVHGRVAMLASLGFIVGEQLKDYPAFYNFDGHIAGPAIYQFQQVEARGAIFWEPLLVAIGLAESWRVAVGWANPRGSGFNSLKEDYDNGDIGFDPLNLRPSDPIEFKDMQTKELNNGRLAMIAIAGFVAQELVDKSEIFEHLFVSVQDEVKTTASVGAAGL